MKTVLTLKTSVCLHNKDIAINKQCHALKEQPKKIGKKPQLLITTARNAMTAFRWVPNTVELRHQGRLPGEVMCRDHFQ